MQDVQFSAFQPSLVPVYPTLAGLVVVINQGSVVVTGTPVTIPYTRVSVAPLSTTYIYADLTSNLLGSNTTGFTGLVYPIAIVTTNQTEVITLVDVRPDVFGGGSGGGGGSSADTVQSVNNSGGVVFPGGTNLFIKATSGAGGITQTLPTAVGLNGQTAKFIKVDAGVGVLTIGTTGGQTINGFSSVTIFNQFQYIVVESDNSNWLIVGNN